VKTPGHRHKRSNWGKSPHSCAKVPRHEGALVVIAQRNSLPLVLDGGI